jgi:predicted transcriptional regulator
MKLRGNTDSEILQPLPDPEALIRTANAEQRRKKQLFNLERKTLLNIATITPLPFDSSPQERKTPPSKHPEMAGASSSSNEPLSAQELLMRLMAVQETSIKLAQANQEAEAEDCRRDAQCLANLEEAMLKLTVKNKSPERQTPPVTG